jgi:hypothetical protein
MSCLGSLGHLPIASCLERILPEQIPMTQRIIYEPPLVALDKLGYSSSNSAQYVHLNTDFLSTPKSLYHFSFPFFVKPWTPKLPKLSPD